MSPRRRAMLLAVCLLLVVGAAGAVLAVRRTSPPATTAVPQDRPGPVLLVPGYGGSTGSVGHLANALRKAGREALVVDLPGNGTGDLREAAKALDAAADAALRRGFPSVDVVGYSAGGVVARYWARELGGAGEARRVVTLGSPHHGTRLAQLGASLSTGACPLACQQLVPGSDFMDALNEGDETPDGPQWLSLWTSQDETVTPPDSARLDGAVDVVLQEVCAGISVSHGALPDTPLVQGIVLRALGPEPVVPPSSADCAALSS